MADINVERKGPSVWPWVIGLLVLALLIWGLVEMFGDAGEPVVVEPVTDSLPAARGTTVGTPPPPLPPDTTGVLDTLPDTADTTAAVTP